MELQQPYVTSSKTQGMIAHKPRVLKTKPNVYLTPGHMAYGYP